MDLPLPDGPVIATTSPGSIASRKSSSTAPPRPCPHATPSKTISPRTGPSATGESASTTSIGSSSSSCTRRSDTRAAASPVYSPISPCTGPISRIW